MTSTDTVCQTRQGLGASPELSGLQSYRGTWFLWIMLPAGDVQDLKLALEQRGRVCPQFLQKLEDKDVAGHEAPPGQGDAPT